MKSLYLGLLVAALSTSAAFATPSEQIEVNCSLASSSIYKMNLVIHKDAGANVVGDEKTYEVATLTETSVEGKMSELLQTTVSVQPRAAHAPMVYADEDGAFELTLGQDEVNGKYTSHLKAKVKDGRKVRDIDQELNCSLN